MKKRSVSLLLALAVMAQLCFLAPSFKASAENEEQISAVNALISALSQSKRNIPIEVSSWDNNTAKTSGEVSADESGTVAINNGSLNTTGGAGSISTASGVFYSVTDLKAKNYDILIKDIEDIEASFSVGSTGYANTLLYIINKKGGYTVRSTHFEAADLYGVNGSNGNGGQLKADDSGKYGISVSKYYDVGSAKNWSNRANLFSWSDLNSTSFNKLYYQFAYDKSKGDFLSGDFTFYRGNIIWNDPEISSALNSLKTLSGDELKNAVFAACNLDTSFMTNEEDVKNAQSGALNAFASDKALYDLTKAYNSLYKIEQTARFDMREVYFAGDNTTSSQPSDRYTDRSLLPDSDNAPEDLGKYFATKTFSYPTNNNQRNAFVIDGSLISSLEDIENIYFWYYSDKTVGRFRFAVYYDGYNQPVRYESNIKIKAGWNRVDLKDYDIKTILGGNDLVNGIRFQPGVVLESGESVTLTMGSVYFTAKRFITLISPASLADAYVSAAAVDTTKYDNGEVLENAIAAVLKEFPALDLNSYLNNLKDTLSKFNTSYPLTISKYRANNSSELVEVNNSSYTFGTEIQGNSYTSDTSGTQPGSIYLSLPENTKLDIKEISDISYDIKVSSDATSSNILTYISNSSGKYIVRGDNGDLPNLDFIGLAKSSGDVNKLEKDTVKTVYLSNVYSKWNLRENFDIFKNVTTLGDILVVAAQNYNASSLTLSNAKVYVGSKDIDAFISAADSCTENDDIFALTAALINYFGEEKNQFYSEYNTLKNLLDNFLSVYGETSSYLSISQKVSEKAEIYKLVSAVNASADKLSDSENQNSLKTLNSSAQTLSDYAVIGDYSSFESELKSFITVLKNIKSVEKNYGSDFRDNSVRLFEALGGNYSLPGHTTGSYEELTVREMVRLQKYLEDGTTLIDKTAADVNSDGVINSYDMSALADLILSEVPFEAVEFADLYGNNEVPYYNAEYSSIDVPMSTSHKNNPYISMYPVRNAKACIVLYPGGGYFQRGDDALKTVAKAFNNLGYFVYICHYRVGNKDNGENGYRGNAILADGRRAIQIARANAGKYGYSAKRIVSCGFSAGGHLAMSVSLHEQKENIVGDSIGEISSVPNAVILGYSVTSVLKPATFGNMDVIFDVNDLGSGEETRAQYVGVNAATKNTPATFIWYGKADAAVHPDLNCKAYYNRLTELGVKTELVGFDGIGHGVSVECLSAPYEYHKKADKFLDEVFK